MLRITAILLCAGSLLPAQYHPANAPWNRPVAPFRIVGNLYYVGSSGVSSYLFTTPQGHVLLDSGFRETAPMIEANLKKLGFRMEDIRILLASHAHYDHAGGLAAIKARTKARFLASPADAPLFAAGGRGDFQLGDRYLFPPVRPDGLLRDGEPVQFGGMVLTPHFTPGHTKGCTSWTTTISDGRQSYRVVIPCSLSAPGYQLVGNIKYPGIVRDFEKSIATLRALPCDIFLAGHAWDFDLPRKMEALKSGGANPFIDPAGYVRYLDRAEAALRRALAAQSGRRKAAH
jgi:metallo-beta-lactamase class B